VLPILEKATWTLQPMALQTTSPFFDMATCRINPPVSRALTFSDSKILRSEFSTQVQ
jgi:hypothetical protein